MKLFKTALNSGVHIGQPESVCVYMCLCVCCLCMYVSDWVCIVYTHLCALVCAWFCVLCTLGSKISSIKRIQKNWSSRHQNHSFYKIYLICQSFHGHSVGVTQSLQNLYVTHIYDSWSHRPVSAFIPNHELQLQLGTIRNNVEFPGHVLVNPNNLIFFILVK
jgi:hypothetical protein